MSVFCLLCLIVFFFFKQKTAYEMRISDWSSDVCSSDLIASADSDPVARSPPLEALPFKGRVGWGWFSPQPPQTKTVGRGYAPDGSLRAWQAADESRRGRSPDLRPRSRVSRPPRHQSPPSASPPHPAPHPQPPSPGRSVPG